MSDGEVRCACPGRVGIRHVNRSGAVSLQVMLGAEAQTGCAGDLLFMLTSAMRVVGLHPCQRMSATTGRLTVMGLGFGEAGAAFCRFVSSDGKQGVQQWTSDGTVISSSQIRCEMPSENREGHMVVEVSRNGVDYTKDEWSVVYHKQATLSALRPSMGPEDGGGVVTVVGLGIMREGGHGFSSFGGQLQPRSDFISSSLVLCLTPKRKGGRNVTVDLVSGYDSEESSRGL